MTTDLDTKLTSALDDAASSTLVSDDAFASILQRAGRSRRERRPSRRFLITGAVIVAATAGAGVTYAAVTDRLTSNQSATIGRIPFCSVDTEDARLVATTTAYGRTVDYWIMDGEGQSAEALFVSGTDVGTGGCGSSSFASAHPTLPWANYAFDNPVDGKSLFWFYGQAPPGTAQVEIVMSTGSTRAPVTTSDGYFVHLAELTYDGVDQFERIDAYTVDGELIASGVTPPSVERNAVAHD
jgi:hypothetical protein